MVSIHRFGERHKINIKEKILEMGSDIHLDPLKFLKEVLPDHLNSVLLHVLVKMIKWMKLNTEMEHSCS